MNITGVEVITPVIPYADDGLRHNVAGKDWTTLDMLLVRADADTACSTPPRRPPSLPTPFYCAAVTRPSSPATR